MELLLIYSFIPTSDPFDLQFLVFRFGNAKERINGDVLAAGSPRGISGLAGASD
jgi:hypothetical protein